jgi:hypothetical protein
MSLVNSIKMWFCKTYRAETNEDNRPYPRIDISVRDTSKMPVRLMFHASEKHEPLFSWFATVEEAEAGCNTMLDNMRLADEANKRIKEKLHGA